MMSKQLFKFPIRLNRRLKVNISLILLISCLAFSACGSHLSSQNANDGSNTSKNINSTTSSANSQTNLPPPPVTLPSSSNGIRRVVVADARKRIKPVYPAEAKEQNIKGDVAVEVIIDEKGGVESARALSGHDLLKDAAVEAALKWKFRVMRINGKPVKILSTLIFSFPPNEKKKE